MDHLIIQYRRLVQTCAFSENWMMLDLARVLVIVLLEAAGITQGTTGTVVPVQIVVWYDAPSQDLLWTNL